MIHHRAIPVGKGTRSRRTVVIFQVVSDLGSPAPCEGVRRFHRGSPLLWCYLISFELSLSSSLARLPASPWVTAIDDRRAAPSAILFFHQIREASFLLRFVVTRLRRRRQPTESALSRYRSSIRQSATHPPKSIRSGHFSRSRKHLTLLTAVL